MGKRVFFEGRERTAEGQFLKKTVQIRSQSRREKRGANHPTRGVNGKGEGSGDGMTRFEKRKDIKIAHPPPPCTPSIPIPSPRTDQDLSPIARESHQSNWREKEALFQGTWENVCPV